jgi:hypothetical protein
MRPGPIPHAEEENGVNQPLAGNVLEEYWRPDVSTPFALKRRQVFAPDGRMILRDRDANEQSGRI